MLLGAPGVGKGTFSSLIQQETGWCMFSVGEILREEIKKKSEIGQKIECNLQQGQLAPIHMVNQLAFDRIDDFHASVVSTSTEPSKSKYGFALMLDGYPRSVEQAEGFLRRYHPTLLMNHHQNTISSDVIAIDIQLDRRVILDKLMGRRICKICKTGYNFADVLYDGYDMPAILPPSNVSSPNVNECCTHPENLIQRDDDNVDTIMKRLNVYEQENQPLVDYLREKNILYSFDVKKGIKDTPQLLQLIAHATNIRIDD